MKKPLISVLMILIVFPSIAYSGYREDFYQEWEQKDFSRMEKTLEDWNRSDSTNMELRVAYGHYFYAKGLAENDRRFMLRSLPYWNSALVTDPWRLDVDFDLAQLYQDLGDFEDQYDLLAKTLQSADKGWRNLRWINGQKLPKRSSKLIPGALQGYISHYFDLHTEEGDEDAHRLAKLSITFYPNLSYAYDSIANYFFRRKDLARGLKYLLIASLKNPKDSQALCGIGDILVELGKRKEARIYYRKAIRLNNDAEIVKKAKEKLAESKLNSNLFP